MIYILIMILCFFVYKKGHYDGFKKAIFLSSKILEEELLKEGTK